jgi:uncharacterized glyoxalase superfamily protein PhnB
MNRALPMLYVEDVLATVAFYERAFGGILDHAQEDGSYAEIRVGDLMVGLVDAADARRHLPVPFIPTASHEPPQAFELYLEVSDADRAVAQATEAGATLLAPLVDKPWGRRVAYVRDSNGVVVELSSPTRGSSVGGHS